MPTFRASAPVGQGRSLLFGDPCPKSHSLNASVGSGGIGHIHCVLYLLSMPTFQASAPGTEHGAGVVLANQ